MTEVRPQRVMRDQPDPAGDHAPLEYDGDETPVLIRIPDLNASRRSKRRTPIAATAAANSMGSGSPTPGKSRRGKRRIHRGHVPQQRPTSASSFEPRTKVFAALFLIAILGLAYAFLKGGDGEDGDSQRTDGWAATSEQVDPVASYEQTQDVDLWPQDTTVPNEPTAARALQTTWPQQEQQVPDLPAESPTAPAAISSQNQFDSPTLSGPAQHQAHETVTSFPSDSAPSTAGPSMPVTNWPSESIGPPSTPIPALPVSHAGSDEGASLAQPDLNQFAKISGLAPRWRGQQQFDDSPNLPRLRKNHDRIQKALR